MRGVTRKDRIKNEYYVKSGISVGVSAIDELYR